MTLSKSLSLTFFHYLFLFLFDYSVLFEVWNALFDYFSYYSSFYHLNLFDRSSF